MASLKKNVISLSVVQFFSYVVPLLQFPYLSRALPNVEIYGMVLYSISTIQLITVLTDYGFGIYIPEIIAKENISTEEISKIFTAAVIIKVGLFLVGFLIFWLIFMINSNYQDYFLFFFISSFTLLGNALLPIWIYQGIELIYVISRLIITTKLLSFLLIFIFVRSNEDVINFAIISSCFSFILSMVSIFILYQKSIKISFAYVDFNLIKEMLVSSFLFFVSRVFTSFYTVGCGVFLGVFSSSLQLVFFNIAEQFYKAGQQVFYPFLQALYPYMVRTKDYSTFWKIVSISMFISMVGVVFGFVFGKDMIRLVFGKEYAAAFHVLNLFLIVLFINTLSNFMSYCALSPLGKANLINLSLIVGGTIQLLSLSILYLFFNSINAINIVWCISICEITMLILRCYFFISTSMKSKKAVIQSK